MLRAETNLVETTQRHTYIVANEETEMLSPALFRGEAGRGAPPYVKSNIALNIGGIYWVHSRDGTNKRN